MNCRSNGLYGLRVCDNGLKVNEAAQPKLSALTPYDDMLYNERSRRKYC